MLMHIEPSPQLRLTSNFMKMEIRWKTLTSFVHLVLSAHWLAQPEFSDAIGQFLKEESRHVDHYIDVVNEHSPYKDETTP